MMYWSRMGVDVRITPAGDASTSLSMSRLLRMACSQARWPPNDEPAMCGFSTPSAFSNFSKKST